MTVKNKKHKISLIIFGALLAYALWLTCRPVKIIAVHHTGNHSAAILVNNLPFTDRDKIAWWQENRAMLKEKYDLPAPADNGFFSVTVWLFGEGYQEDNQDDDQYCFKDMQTMKHCIEKTDSFTIYSSRGNQAHFSVDNGGYILKNNGEIIKTSDK
ncbi:MAG: DUF943 family protein [Mixta calida]|nr:MULTISPECIES: DUF943 family protein [Mixta]AIX73697.1 hypothetical protein PSNIH2_07800 [Pantoea sp. PSNIH2]MBS6058040.1 DUF943 family protein [Pantoea sp.]POU48608.1 DUF943 domain-containing protein [Pantoea sp. PSNIH5]POU66328.1 DUF943 domain-containing protein [Pantoea sp. PSNIH4]POY68379.1 DUF943 domain-containing protein [Pantoea sp. PSNIH3]